MAESRAQTVGAAFWRDIAAGLVVGGNDSGGVTAGGFGIYATLRAFEEGFISGGHISRRFIRR